MRPCIKELSLARFLSSQRKIVCNFNVQVHPEDQESYIQLLLNKFPHPWNKYFSDKFENFAKSPTVIRSVAAVQSCINQEMMRLCLQEQRRRYIKEVTVCCESNTESG